MDTSMTAVEELVAQPHPDFRVFYPWQHRHVVYLLHFDRPYYHCRHYLGCTTNLERRLKEHQRGDTPLFAALQREGIAFEVARIWYGDWRWERQLKRRKNSPRYCPVCRPPVIPASSAAPGDLPF